MWSSENERLGFKRCTPAGYVLAELGAVAYLVAGFVFLAACVEFLIDVFSTGFSWGLMPMILLAAFLAGAAWTLHRIAWGLAQRKGFVYEHKADRCTWTNEKGGMG